MQKVKPIAKQLATTSTTARKWLKMRNSNDKVTATTTIANAKIKCKEWLLQQGQT